MRARFHAQLIRGLFATGCAALGVATWNCSSTGPRTEPTGTKDSELTRWPPPPPPASSAHALHNDNARSGANLNETVLTPSNVAKSFGYLYDLPVEGVVYAQPLVAANVTIGGTLYRSVVYVVTMHNMVYAFDGSGVDADAAPRRAGSSRRRTRGRIRSSVIAGRPGSRTPRSTTGLRTAATGPSDPR